MAAAVAMTAASCGGAGAARSLSRFRGCLAGALLGDCVGAIYEAQDTVDLTSVLRHVQSLEPDPGSPGSARTGGRGPGAGGRAGEGAPRGPQGGVGARPGEAGVGRAGSVGRWAQTCGMNGPCGHRGLSLAKSELRLRTSCPSSERGSTSLPAVPATNLGVIVLNCASPVHTPRRFYPS